MASASVRRATLIAPPSWRAIDFVSDLHLCDAMPRTAAAFAHWLDTTDADAVLLLGDVFEVWIGADYAGHDAFAEAQMAMLRHAASRRFVGMMVGNRDFLMAPDTLADAGITALDDPCVLDAFGRRIVLAHGDALCLDDVDYQRFRQQVRAPAWQAAFLAKPRAERAAIARALRDASEARKQASHGANAPAITYADADPAATRALLAADNARVLVHGHTHRPRTHVPAVDGGDLDTTRHVLSDWDLDTGAVPRAEVMRLTARGFERRSLISAP